MTDTAIVTAGVIRYRRLLLAIAASAFGAGFGGAVWAAFTAERADRGSQSWLTAYRARHPEHAGAASLHLIHKTPFPIKILPRTHFFRLRITWSRRSCVSTPFPRR